ncbi:ketoacyl reductase [Mycobacteroides immunogenum]|uniref:Ketoacyl reductase n=1 Tax=Mycobacteroides immunogenum TaxID=83262 RepID=A0A179VFG7_9MYCO|nr:SDR family oxidoreductase [Mycobacteroides immunogenum]OAT69763.1 ketoacyl reductase [Mycobacteroides immunogenum]
MTFPPPSVRGRVVVTGASSGIGREIARALAQRGHSLILVARRGDRLAQLAAELSGPTVEIEARACDLTDHSQRATLCKELGERDIAALVNNAGVATYGPLSKADPGEERAEVELDVNAVHDLVLAVLPGMLERRTGALLLTGSTAGNQIGPNNATYSAAKAFVNSFAESLHYELKGTGVSCTLLAPGPVATEFAEVAALNSTVTEQDWIWTNPTAVARSTLRAMDRGQRRVVPGLIAKVQTLGAGLTPTIVVGPIIRTVYGRLSV